MTLLRLSFAVLLGSCSGVRDDGDAALAGSSSTTDPTSSGATTPATTLGGESTTTASSADSDTTCSADECGADPCAGIDCSTSEGGGEPFANAIWSLEASVEISRDGADWAGSTDLVNPITTHHPGFTAKVDSIEKGSNGGAGYIYTVDPTTEIPWSSVNPSLRVPRVFRFEALPELAGETNGTYQTDFYLQRGTETADDDGVMPADHWLQYWIAIEQASDSGFAYHGGKLWYPCRDGHGSCHYYSSMGVFGASSSICAGASADPATEGFVFRQAVNLASTFTESSDAIDPEGLVYPDGTGTDDRGKLGPSDPVNGVLHWNEWVLVKTHSYVSGMSPDGDWYYNHEEWWRRHGSPTWHKVMDWRTGEMVCGGSTAPFEWRLSQANGYEGRRGHNMLRFPTTIGEAGGEPSSNMNIYMADIIMASDEADLPVYTDAE